MIYPPRSAKEIKKTNHSADLKIKHVILLLIRDILAILAIRPVAASADEVYSLYNFSTRGNAGGVGSYAQTTDSLTLGSTVVTNDFPTLFYMEDSLANPSLMANNMPSYTNRVAPAQSPVYVSLYLPTSANETSPTLYQTEGIYSLTATFADNGSVGRFNFTVYFTNSADGLLDYLTFTGTSVVGNGPGGQDTVTVSGALHDGTYLANWRSNGYGETIDVPEPAGGALLGAGALAVLSIRGARFSGRR